MAYGESAQAKNPAPPSGVHAQSARSGASLDASGEL
jgi:hypothetical protein